MRVFKFCFILLAGMQMVFAVSDQEVDAIHKSSDFLTPKLLMKIFKGDNLNKAYAQAQIEDFETESTAIFTKEMVSFMSKPYSKWFEELKKYPGYVKLINIKSKTEQERLEIIQAWRYTFLTKLMNAVRYRNSLKPTFRFFVASETSYDSNVDKTPEQANTAAAVSSSGKADWQQLLVLHTDWEPFINNKKIPRDIHFSQSFNVITISQAKHKENEVLILDTEPKISKTYDSYLRKVTLGYRFQHFEYSGDEDSRNTSSLFQSHRLKLGVDSQATSFWLDFVDSVKHNWYVSYTDKRQYAQSLESLNSQDVKVGWASTFFYDDERLRGLLEYSDYQTDDYVNGEYRYLRAVLTHYHSHKLSFLKNKIHLSEEISYRLKSWNDYDGNKADRDEDTYYIKAKASTALTDKSDISLSIKYLSRETDEQFLGIEEADQTVIGLGLNWRTP